MLVASRTLLKLKQGPKLVRTNFSWQVYAKPLKIVSFPEKMFWLGCMILLPAVPTQMMFDSRLKKSKLYLDTLARRREREGLPELEDAE